MPNTTTAPVFPVIHLNGSSAPALKDQVYQIVIKLREAASTLAENGPHARDYYVAGPDAFSKAREQHVQHLVALDDMAEFYENMWNNIDEQDQNNPW